jgi:hypothetical protein
MGGLTRLESSPATAGENEAVRELGRAEAGGHATQHDPQQQRCGNAAGDLADDVADRLGGGDRACGEHADGHGRVHVPSRYTAIGVDEDHQGEAMGEGNRGDTAAGSSADD